MKSNKWCYCYGDGSIEESTPRDTLFLETKKNRGTSTSQRIDAYCRNHVLPVPYSVQPVSPFIKDALKTLDFSESDRPLLVK